jgi:hypothetical protein
MGIFTDWQPKYAAVGIATVPIDPETKIFSGPWNKIGFPASTELTRKAKYRDCNGIGFVCGPRNGITDVDIDPCLVSLQWRAPVNPQAGA